MNRKKIYDNQEVRDFLKQFKVTNVVVGRGHDCGGLICFLKLGSKILVDFHDDGWGGQPEIRYPNNEAMELLHQKLKDFNYAQKMFDNGWEFMKSPDRIGIESQVEDVISALVSIKEDDKNLRRQEKKGLFIQEPNGNRSTIFWKGFSIKKLLEHPQGEATLRKKILELQNEGNIILNTNLGSILPQK